MMATSCLSLETTIPEAQKSASPSLSILAIPFQVVSLVSGLKVSAPQKPSAGWIRVVVKLRERFMKFVSETVRPVNQFGLSALLL